MSTPFDEESVDMIQKLEIEIIKVASCSAKDWPLLEKIRIEAVVTASRLYPKDVVGIRF